MKCLNVSACDYSELKSILIHAHYKGIFICLGFLTFYSADPSSNQLRTSIPISPFSEIL